MNIKIATADEHILSCLDVIRALRPHLLEADFLQTVREAMVGGLDWL